MAGERETAYGMTPRWASSSATSRPAAHGVSLSNVGQVGLALALRLLEAGYQVVGSGIDEDCQQQFQAAGGALATGNAGQKDMAWEIAYHERPGVRPEVLARVTEQHRGYRRPRLEVRGSIRAPQGRGDITVGSLTVRSGLEHESNTGLQVTLDVSPRGLQLVVRGERTLFEAALPLLTVLADRVLYAGSATMDLDENDTLSCELPSRNHA